MLFQGEEWCASTPFLYFTDHPDPELGEAVKRGRRNEFAAFGWDPESIPDPQAKETFLRSKLAWEERSQQPHSDLYDWYRSLLDLRRRFPSLTDGRLQATKVHFDETARWLILSREPVLVVCNFADGLQRITLPELATKEIVLFSAENLVAEDEVLAMPGHSVAILSVSKPLHRSENIS
jgi:maltooligosyltrehalose trehalohydrolase